MFVACDKDEGIGTSSEAVLVDYQKKADDMEWRWSKEHATLRWCISEYLSDYEVKLIEDEGPWGRLTIQISDKGELIHSFRGHHRTVFVRSGNVLYVAEFGPISSGCGVSAFDMKEREQRWWTRLKGIGDPPHSKYYNAINIEMEEGAILVFGNEAFGRYIEYLDPATGKTVGHRRLAGPGQWPAWPK
jgi:hypothetical protein